jgi:4a-hydroxytetrahydrobiopterin dehydratase
MALSEQEITTLHAQIPDWEIIDVNGIKRLRRIFTFQDFAAALAFTNKVGAIAEAQGHHPALLTEWGKVTVQWWTHSVGGLDRTDFLMAEQTDAL